MVLNENSSWNQTNVSNCKYHTNPKSLNIMIFCTSPKSIRRITWTATYMYEQAIFSQSSIAAPVGAAFEVWQRVLVD